MVRYALVASLVLAVAGSAASQEEPARSRRSRGAPAPLPRPTEADLGVPIYPGARYDGEISGGMSSGDWRYWVFFTDDAPGKVLAFYEQKTGKKGTTWEPDKHMVSLSGSGPMPDHGVSIETLSGNPLFGGRGKTMFTVARNSKP